MPYRIVMALAGFSNDDVEVVTENNRLSIRGRLKDTGGAEPYRYDSGCPCPNTVEA
jgi:HSP20 family molecular chaperone IbpA